MARLLIVDDEVKIREMIKKYAVYEGYQVFEAGDGFKAVAMVKDNDYDLIVMDVMMPGLDGFSAVRDIRKIKNIPVIMLSARGEEYDRIHGFEVGVDDYVVKPFSVKELMMRISAVLARGKDAAGAENKVETIEGLKIDYSARIVYVDDQPLELSLKEYDLLSYLIRNENVALTREKLITDVWGYDYYGDDRTLDTHIKLLRRSLGPYQKFIVTLRGVGYRFEVK